VCVRVRKNYMQNIQHYLPPSLSLSVFLEEPRQILKYGAYMFFYNIYKKKDGHLLNLFNLR